MSIVHVKCIVKLMSNSIIRMDANEWVGITSINVNKYFSSWVTLCGKTNTTCSWLVASVDILRWLIFMNYSRRIFNWCREVNISSRMPIHCYTMCNVSSLKTLNYTHCCIFHSYISTSPMTPEYLISKWKEILIFNLVQPRQGATKEIDT